MRTRHFLSFCVLLAAAGAHAAGATAPTLSPHTVASRFRAATGIQIRPDVRTTYAGHWVALSPLPSQANLGRFGTITIYVLNGTDRATDLHDLLADGHTGQLGTAGAGGIYWEGASLISGGKAWLAKKRYGDNVVLWRYGTERRVDRSFRELHRALTRIVSG